MAVEAPPAPPATAPSAPPAPPPPSKPAPPSAPPRPASTGRPPAHKSEPVSEPADNFDDAIFKLGQVADKESGEAKPPPKDGKQVVPAPKPDEEAPPAPKDGEQAAPVPKEGEKPAPVKARTLREYSEELKAKNAELQQKLQTLEAEKTKAPAEDLKKLTETLAEREKRLAELDEEIRFSNYERSQEYKNEYWKPFEQAYQEGAATVAGLKITDPQTGEMRQATFEDFEAIMRIRDENTAAEAIEALFGTGVKAQMVTDARRHAERLNQKRLNALEDHKKNGAERERQRQDQWRQDSEKILKQAGELWQRHRTAPHEKHPLFFRPIEGDAEGNKLLEDGFKEADEAFSNMNPLDPRLSGDQREAILRRHATAYNKMAAFNRLAHLFKQERSLRMAIEKKLKDFENSEPGAGDGAGGGAPAQDTMGQAVADLNKYIGR
jgi:hypothetical protein